MLCWSVGLETLSYGEHNGKVEQVVNPIASPIVLVPEKDRNEAWQSSYLRQVVNDDAWHHFAVVVDPLDTT